MKFKKGLLAKMFLFIGIPIALIISIAAFIAFKSVHSSVTQLTNNQLTADSKSASYQIENYFSKYSQMVLQMKTNELFQQYFQKSDADKMNIQQYKAVKKTVDNMFKTDPSNISSVWIADTKSNIVIMSDSANPVSTNIAERPWYEKIAENGSTVMIEPYEDFTNHTLVASIITPIYASSNNLAGFAGIDISIDKLAKAVKKYKLGETGFYILTTNNGKMIYHPDKNLINKNISQSKMSKNIIDAIQNKKDGNITYSAMNENVHGYISLIGNTGWSITAGLPEKEFNSDYYRLLNTIVSIFIVTIILLVLVMILVSKNITNPLKKLKAAAQEIADGNLDVEVNIKSSDETGEVADAFKRTVNKLKQYIEYIDEISYTLDQISQGKLYFDLHCDYSGDFAKIKISLENIKSQLVKTFDEISNSADQVAIGSEQVSTASQSLAQGATEQASSVEELSASISEISNHADKNSKNAESANEIAEKTSEEIHHGSENMQKLVDAMDQINKSSNEISKIIKTIEGIAFQTNILSLNAAVEAARAGAAGKGFSVVADEVRNLANKSAEAAATTTSLIQNSIDSVKNGTEIVNQTVGSLKAVISSASKTKELVNNISVSSKEQSNSIKQISLGFDQISNVVQTNSATSEESAASSEELSGQAKNLKSLVSYFKTSASEDDENDNDISDTDENDNNTSVSDENIEEEIEPEKD